MKSAIAKLNTLLPIPRKIELRVGELRMGNHEDDSQFHTRISRSIDPRVSRPQRYILQITPEAARIVAHDAAGLFYGERTLRQLTKLFPNSIPCMEIEDWPDFPARGVMLDVSRDKVPTMETLFKLVDQLSQIKINQLQLYIEHTFAYSRHEDVWRNASPFTADEIRRLDAYCRDRFIELVPNQNSFGHMERWLRHPRYLPLAEAPDGADTPWGFFRPGPFSLCPTDPKSLDLLSELYAELLPNFSSRLFNVGCDETFDVGQGRSRAICEKLGKTRVYLDFLSKVNELVTRHGRRMMFWGDIILQQPDLIDQLPKDIIALEWGYEADHPFDRDGALFAKAGVPFYVCPGTSSWCSIAGRTDNMLSNLRAAAEAGAKHGAVGFLNTDWGDHGHLQYLPVSHAGFAAGAAFSWCAASNVNLNLADALAAWAFESPDGHETGAALARVALDLGNVYQSVGKLIKNGSALFRILIPIKGRDPLDGITISSLEEAERAINTAMAPIDTITGLSADQGLIVDEFRNAAALLSHACRRGRWKLLPDSIKPGELAEELREIVTEHRRVWLARNRVGGLDDSARRLQLLVEEYEQSQSTEPLI